MEDQWLIQFDRVGKRFGGITALKGVSFGIRRGACHGLVGENGAGKSTLGKILAGIHGGDEGTVRIGGTAVRFGDPREALAAGIAIVHQELAFCENLSVAENLCLADLPRRGPFVTNDVFVRAEAMLAPLGAAIDVRRTVGDLSVAQQQLVQIAGALSHGAGILVFDEPTSSLSQAEARRLFEQIKDLRTRGVTAIYVSHHLDEIFELCDAVTVLRDGEVIGTHSIRDVDKDRLVEMMIGRTLEVRDPGYLANKPGPVRLRVEDLSSPGNFEHVSFEVRAGEILGLAGLVGAGRTQIAQALFGLDPNVQGRVCLDGQPVCIRKPADALNAGMALIPEDRRRFGLVMSMTARENITLPTLPNLARWCWINRREEDRLAESYFRLLRIKADGLDASALSLSGGNQQKLVLARWLAAHAKILLIDEPTRGVDVGAKAEIHRLIDDLARQGTAILLISSELPELLHLSTRTIVLRNGRIAGELPRAQADQETILRLMAGLP